MPLPPPPSSPAPKDCHVTYVPLLQPSAQSGQQRLIPGRRQSGPGRRGRGGIQFLRRPRHPHNFHPSPTDRGTDRRTRRERRACVSLTGPKANNLHLGHVSLLDHLRSELHHVAAHDGRPRRTDRNIISGARARWRDGGLFAVAALPGPGHAGRIACLCGMRELPPLRRDLRMMMRRLFVATLAIPPCPTWHGGRLT